ncbi:hypothetical protein [Actinomadura livida]|uniref:Uncharacterized protein n=1 Tax=Actinomadura livida TaxID=79909 RepID=A0A7W7N1D2_9ACTN|nr:MULTISPECIES: hypothetical protein [Actinomadura]MBB4778853.1 hypothetical protein [Actinomadura catellatispora]GGU26257.1 hypothetical protein GCM10010208_58760 [Actinomadura livida]
MSAGSIGKYLYWSGRRIEAFAADNGLDLGPKRQLSIKSPGSIGGVPVPQVELAGGEKKQRNLRRAAAVIEKALGDQAVSTFADPPPALFAKGVGQVSFAKFVGGPASDKAALLHTRTRSTSGQRVELCLFGSLDNTAGFRTSDALDTGWSSSASQAIEELLQSHGRQNSSQWDDEESRAVEALKIALNQGITGGIAEHENRPWTRGYTLGHARNCEWLAEIYTDVILDGHRWDFRGSLAGAERIMVGVPLWVRTASPNSIVRYAEMRRDASEPPTRRWRRRLG